MIVCSISGALGGLQANMAKLRHYTVTSADDSFISQEFYKHGANPYDGELPNWELSFEQEDIEHGFWEFDPVFAPNADGSILAFNPPDPIISGFNPLEVPMVEGGPQFGFMEQYSTDLFVEELREDLSTLAYYFE